MAEKKLMKGNEALAEGAIRAGCRFFAGYPITPQNEIPEYMSRRMPQVGGTYLQAESELAAINMLYGAGGSGPADHHLRQQHRRQARQRRSHRRRPRRHGPVAGRARPGSERPPRTGHGWPRAHQRAHPP